MYAQIIISGFKYCVKMSYKKFLLLRLIFDPHMSDHVFIKNIWELNINICIFPGDPYSLPLMGDQWTPPSWVLLPSPIFPVLKKNTTNKLQIQLCMHVWTILMLSLIHEGGSLGFAWKKHCE